MPLIVTEVVGAIMVVNVKGLATIDKLTYTFITYPGNREFFLLILK
jgi:hypothetical protein